MASSTRSLLLDTLPPDARASLNGHEEEHPLSVSLIKAGERPDFMFFPHQGALVSIIRSTESGSMVEVGVIGWEGVFDVHCLLTTVWPVTS